MLADLLQSPEPFSIDDCLNSSITDDLLLNFDYEEDLTEEPINPPIFPSTANNNILSSSAVNAAETSPATHSTTVLSCYDHSTANNNIPSSAVTAAETSPATHSTTVLPCYDPSFTSTSTFSPFDSLDGLSDLLNPQPPPEPEPDIFPSLSTLPMAPIYPTNELNQMISPPAVTSYSTDCMVNQLPLNLFGTSYSQDSMANQLPLDLVNQLPLDLMNQIPLDLFSTSFSPDSVANQLPLGYSGYLGVEPSTMRPCSFADFNGGIGGEFYAGGMGVPTCGAEGDLGFFGGPGMAVRSPETMEACGFGIYGPGTMQRVYGQGDFQVLGDSQHLMAGCNSSGAAPLQVTSDISTLEDSHYKVGRISMEERQSKIDRFMKKRNERNFSKKIKYACRKTLADSRPRVRGRFAKNDEFGEVAPPRPSSDVLDHQYDDEENIKRFCKSRTYFAFQQNKD